MPIMERVDHAQRRSVQFAFDSVYEIPFHERPGVVKQTLGSVWVLATVGLGLVVTTLLSGFVSSSASGVHLGVIGHIAGYVIAAALDVGIFVAAFRILSHGASSTREVLPGALLSGVAFFVLQELSALIVSHYLQKAQSTYGHFGTVITILWWFYIQANVALLGAQLNVVLKEDFFPRSLRQAPQTPADHRVLAAYAAERTYHPDQVVDTRLDDNREREEGTFQPRSARWRREEGNARSAQGEAVSDATESSRGLPQSG